jgi:MarR family transcriptional regulator, transcriptional regulator for hemolysin
VLSYDFQSDLGYWLHIAAHRFEEAMRLELGDQGISYRQCQILAWLALEGELCQARLAELMNVRAPSIVKVLDRMEREGLIVREPNPDDRRIRTIRPTPGAIPVWQRIVRCARTVRQQSEQGLSEGEVDLLRKLIGRVYENLDPTNLSQLQDSATSPTQKNKAPSHL